MLKGPILIFVFVLVVWLGMCSETFMEELPEVGEEACSPFMVVEMMMFSMSCAKRYFFQRRTNNSPLKS